MRILVHICCGPCAIMVLERLKNQGHDPAGLFFNPNIQPLAEYLRRREGAALVAGRLNIPLLFADSLTEAEQRWRDPWLREDEEQDPPDKQGFPPAADPAPWLRAVSGREGGRCRFCWRIRLQKTAELAAKWGYDAFTSSLLYSRHQQHESIRELGLSFATASATVFAYEDFRLYWHDGVRKSREWGIYRQQYCGCLYSEYDRYRRDFSRLCSAQRG